MPSRRKRSSTAPRERASRFGDYSKLCKEAGHDTLPGTSAEILDDSVRDVISKGRITTAQWIEVITTAHELGHPHHLDHHVRPHRDLRALDPAHGAPPRHPEGTGGFTEFVPLSFIHQEAPMHMKQLVPGRSRRRHARRGREDARGRASHAGRHLPQHPGLVGQRRARDGAAPLSCGCNDLGGTLINESISTSAGSSYGQLVPPRELRRLIREVGRVPVQRTSAYAIRAEVSDARRHRDEPPRRDRTIAEARFGSYRRLTLAAEFRFCTPRAAMKVVALAGGTGAAKFLRGLSQMIDPADLTIIGNTGDDLEIWGLYVSPDLDTVELHVGGIDR